MRKIKLGIYTSSLEYTNNLMEYINNKSNLPINAVGLTGKEAVVEFSKSNPHSAFLVEDIVNEKDFIGINKYKSLILGQENKILEEELVIDKYQSAEVIINNLMEYLIDYYDLGIDSNGVTSRIVGLYSPCRGEVERDLAMGICNYLGGSRALYISFNEFETIGSELEGADLSDLMYFYLRNNPAVPTKAQMIVKEYEGVSYIPPVKYSKDLRNIDTGQWLSLIEKISQGGQYEYIVVDIGSVVSDPFEMLKACDYKYLVAGEDFYQRRKIEEVKTFLSLTDENRLLEELVDISTINFAKEEKGIFLEKLMMGSLGTQVENIVKGFEC